MTAEDNAACRICLSTETHKSYSLLRNHENIEHLQAALALRTDLNDNSIEPSHICDECEYVTQKFLKLREEALDNDVFVVNYQQQILTNGLKAVKETQKMNIIIPGTKIDKSFIYEHFENEEMEFTMKEENIDEEDIEDIVINTSETNSTVCSDQFSQSDEADKYLETCNVCGKTCKNKHVLKSHMHVHTSKIVKCPKCTTDKFLKEISLKKHLKNSHREADVSCEFPGCEKMFKSREVMLRHIKGVHMLERTICSNCGTAVANLSYHLETCNKDNLEDVTCKICNKQFSCKLYLSTHEKTVHGPPARVVCTICGKAVKDMKSHTKWKHSANNKKTNCCAVEGCDAMFRTKPELRTHNNRVHLDLKTQCDICLQWLKCLPEHMSQVHHQDRKHVCSMCGKQFFKNSDLKTHMERVHQGRRYICPECGKTVSKIREHMKCVHGISDIDQYSISVVTYSDTI